MEGTNRLSVQDLEKLLQVKYKDYFLARWQECIEKKIKVRLVVDFENGRVTGVQDQAIVSGSSVIDFYSKKMLDIDTTE